jgi:hypothetical protein
MNTFDLAVLPMFDLYALHWDERGNSITASFEGPLDRGNRRAWNAPPEHNRIRFHLQFPAVSDLEIRSWSHQLPIKIEQIELGDRVSVLITGEETNVRFTASFSILVGHSTSIVGME